MSAKSSKASQGKMRERTPGHWQIRAFAGLDPVTGRPRQIARTVLGTKTAARNALRALEVEIQEGKRRDTAARTVGDLLDKWLEVAETRQRPRTLYENRSKIENRIRPRLGYIRLDKLGAADLDAAYREWLTTPLNGATEPLSPASVMKLHAILSAALRQAAKWGWIGLVPTALASPPRVTSREMLVPTPEQLTKLIREAEKSDPVLTCAIALAALTGARRGELTALRWSDIDLTRDRVRISKSLTVTGGVQHTGPTKTHALRDLALDPVASGVLRFRWDSMKALAKAAESPLIDDPYVLSYNANGALPVNPDTLTHRFAALCRALEGPALKRLKKVDPNATRANLPPAKRWPFRFHDLRHFSVTTLIAAGVDARTVAARHGHSRATMTLDRYAHALPERDRAAAGILGESVNL